MSNEGTKIIVLDYEAREFKAVTAFADGALKPIVGWMRQELQVDLTTCAADSHKPKCRRYDQVCQGKSQMYSK